jgi:hypothetical protein
MSGGGERRTRLDGESVCGGDEKGDDEGGDGEDHGKTFIDSHGFGGWMGYVGYGAFDGAGVVVGRARRERRQ